MPIGFRNHSVAAKYCLALAAIGVAMLLHHVTDPLLGGRYPFVPQFVALLAIARFIGLGPALLAFVLALTPDMYNFLFQAHQEPPFARFVGLSGGILFSTYLIWLLDRQGRLRVQMKDTSRLAAERLEQLRIEVEQREREQATAAHLRAVVESSEDAIISTDLGGIIRSWNRGAEKIFGFAEQEAVGKTLSIMVPEDRRYEETDILNSIRQGAAAQHFETVRKRKDGRAIQVSLTISPVRDGKGAVTGASHIARDITERRQFEQQLRETQKLESLGVLAGGLAHDFNNLLTGIMGNASLVTDDLGPSSKSAARLGEILSASERAAVLVRQMLAYAGKGRFVLQLLDLSKQVQEIVPLIRTSFSPSVRLLLNLAPDLPPVEADPSQMQQLIMNLAINGGEAITGSGSVTVTTSTRQSDAEQQVVLQVKDTGCGMDEETKARIFDPFFTTKFPGRGLGLAAVLGIIRSHHGTISVQSAPGAGTTFTVVLPASSAAPEAPRQDPQFELRGYGHVLVVDDEELVRNLARAALERCGYSVETAGDGLMAVAAVASHPLLFDAVLLDLTLPAMGGDEALREIRAIREDLPVILSSGFSEVEALRRFADQGLSGFLQKPYTASALARKMKLAIDHGQRQRL
jgi:PAS domain S-box-containing protein